MPNSNENFLNNEYIYIPGYVPIPLLYLYQQFNKKEKNQESNSVSQLSTTSDGEHNMINNNTNSNYNNIYNYNSIMPINKDEKKDEKLNLRESIKKGIKDISNFYNSNNSDSCPLSLASYYHCNLTLSANEEFYLNLKLNEFIKDSKKRIKNMENIINEKNKGQ